MLSRVAVGACRRTVRLGGVEGVAEALRAVWPVEALHVRRDYRMREVSAVDVYYPLRALGGRALVD